MVAANRDTAMGEDRHDAGRESVEILEGGNMGGAVRVGGTVRRPAGPWSPTVQRLLGHLRRQGLDWVPEPLGVDDEGRDRVSYLPGMVPQDPLPEWLWSDAILVRAVQRLGDLHDASATFDATDATWRFPVHHPVEVVCHNDFAPYNMVFRDRQLTGVIDWDTASPGPRVWDLAYLAYRLVPLTHPDNHDGLASPRSERTRRLRLLCDTYGRGVEPSQILPVAVQRLHDLADFTESLVAEGRPQLRSHVDLYLRDGAWIDANADSLHTV